MFVFIGLEIHLTLNTTSKMFSDASNDNEGVLKPNTAINEIDLALPGTLPSINKEAVAKGLKLAELLNCKIAEVLSFDRKNYYYEDLPKGFQITQYFNPLGKNGFLQLSNKKITINEMHLEEDTAKIKNGMLNYNRAGCPLIELVTDPCFSNENEVKEFLLKLIMLLKENDISTASLSKGKFRVDVNISISNKENELGTKIELKGLNNLKNITKAIKYEINRQITEINAGSTLQSHTRWYDEKNKQTIFARKKDSVVDYRFMPEANLLPIPMQEVRKLITK